MPRKKKSLRGDRSTKALIIEPFKQVKLGLYVLAVSLAFVIMTALIFLNAFSEQYRHVMEIFQVVDPKLQWEVVTNDVFFTNVVRILALLAAFIIVMMVVVFRVTHKYYGPLVAIEKFVDGIAEGEYSRRVVIRKGDELQDLVRRLNSMAEKLEKRHIDRVKAG